MADGEAGLTEDLPLESQTSEPLLEGALSGDDLEGAGEEDNGDLSCGSGFGSELAAGTSTGRGEGEHLADNLSDGSDGAWDTDIDTEDEKEEYDATGGAAYRKCCEILGIIPVSHLLRDLQNNVTSVSLRHHGLGPKGAKAVSAALASNTCVTHLDLSDCGLGTEGAVAITTMFKENCYITHLDLSDNQIEAAGALAVAGMLESNNTLTHLSLRGSDFNDKAAEPISEVIKTSYQISYLDLSHNQFGEAAGVLLGEALSESEVLQTLNLSWNNIRRKGAVALANGLKVNQMLKVLNLSHNGLGDEGATALVEALKINTTLSELDISANRFLQATASLFATKVLPVCETLKVLRMGKNSMQKVYPESTQPVGDVASLLEAASSSSLTLLDLSGYTFTLAMADKVIEMEEKRPDLTVIYGGTGGYSKTKPLTPPLEKLVKYAEEHSLVLEDLFRSFDKEETGQLSGEMFKSSLKHIQAPLLGFERQKLIKEFGKTEATEETSTIDYMALVQAATSTRDTQ
ncbi:Leucine-rich repeat-containing protein 74A [Geodia barretti]|uniref:Leucine-rich repeat-containing protein 74A n=1 Tax=Geodia barretti TaxID=519541 RepID=A0AA35RQZ4_GEOBA|nr:Leucine-rich repeat-containing protein 74A [Geodia barretti]